MAATITGQLGIPTIGIGAGPDCDGQVLVFHDIFGLSLGHRPKFVRHYAELGEVLMDAAKAYMADVKAGAFPGPEHEYHAAAELEPGVSAARRA